MHVSAFEAEAYARWRGARLPTEAEWEHAAALFEPERGALDQLAFGPGPGGPVRRRLLGVDRRASFDGYPGFEASRTPSTRRSSSAPATACCAAPRGRRARASRGRPSATGTTPSAARSSPASGARESMSVVIDRLRDPRHAARRRARRADAVAQGAAAEVLLRRARVGAVRPDHVAARVLPDALRAPDPQPPLAGDRPLDGRGGAGRARLRDGLEDARPAVRDGGPRLAAALRPVRRRPVGGRGLRRRAHRALPRPGRARRGRRLRPRPRPHPRRRAAPVRVPRRHDRQPAARRRAPSSWRGCASRWATRTGS